MPDCYVNLLFLPRGRNSPGSGGVQGDPGDAGTLWGAVRALCRNAPNAQGLPAPSARRAFHHSANPPVKTTSCGSNPTFTTAQGLHRESSCLGVFPCCLPLVQTRPLLSGWLILYRGGGGWGSEAKKKFVYLKSTSKFGPL